MNAPFDLIHVDLSLYFSESPPSLDFVWDGFLSGTVGTLFSPGATGKSFFALEAAMSVAGFGADGTDPLQLNPQHHGRVVYLAAEDPSIVLWHRLHAMGSHLSHDARAMLSQHLEIIPVSGAGFSVIKHEPEILSKCHGARLIIIDTLSRVHVLDENSNSDMAMLMQRLDFIAKETGAAVLFLHHVSKGSVSAGTGSTQQASRGASVLTDNARYGASLYRMQKSDADSYRDAEFGQRAVGDFYYNYVRFDVPKNNYSSPIDECWFRRGEGGILRPCSLLKITDTQKNKKNSWVDNTVLPDLNGHQHDGFGDSPLSSYMLAQGRHEGHANEKW
jgi:hypothetical protein